MAAVRSILEEAAAMCGGGRIAGAPSRKREPPPPPSHHFKVDGGEKVKMKAHFNKVEGGLPTMSRRRQDPVEPEEDVRIHQPTASVYDREGIKTRWQHDLYNEPSPLQFSRSDRKPHKYSRSRQRYPEEDSSYATVNFNPVHRGRQS